MSPTLTPGGSDFFEGTPENGNADYWGRCFISFLQGGDDRRMSPTLTPGKFRADPNSSKVYLKMVQVVMRFEGMHT